MSHSKGKVSLCYKSSYKTNGKISCTIKKKVAIIKLTIIQSGQQSATGAAELLCRQPPPCQQHCSLPREMLDLPKGCVFTPCFAGAQEAAPSPSLVWRLVRMRKWSGTYISSSQCSLRHAAILKLPEETRAPGKHFLCKYFENSKFHSL